MQTLKVTLLNEKSKAPAYAHPGDAGLDLFSVEQKAMAPGESVLIKTGLVLELPPNTEAQVRPRSGLALNHQVTVLNSPGTIDHGYRGEVGIILINHGQKPFVVEVGMKIAQLVISPVVSVSVLVVDSLTESERGASGFGSTGLS